MFARYRYVRWSTRYLVWTTYTQYPYVWSPKTSCTDHSRMVLALSAPQDAFWITYALCRLVMESVVPKDIMILDSWEAKVLIMALLSSFILSISECARTTSHYLVFRVRQRWRSLMTIRLVTLRKKKEKKVKNNNNKAAEPTITTRKCEVVPHCSDLFWKHFHSVLYPSELTCCCF